MKAVVTLALVATLAVACGSGDDDGRPTIVATHSILGDLVEHVVGDEADVEVLMPRGADPHEFQPSAAQVAMVQEADVVVANGFGFEAGLADALAAAADDGVPIVELASRVDPIGDDPHWFTDPARAADAVDVIAQEIVSNVHLEPSPLLRNATEYARQIREADAAIEALLAPIPRERRVLVTNHEVFAYFADRYDFDVVGVIIPGGTTLNEPSSSELADLVDVIEEEDVPAIFADTSASDELAQTLAEEVGGDVEVVELYSESLGEEGSEADTYLGLILTDAHRIAEALGA